MVACVEQRGSQRLGAPASRRLRRRPVPKRARSAFLIAEASPRATGRRRDPTERGEVLGGGARRDGAAARCGPARPRRRTQANRRETREAFSATRDIRLATHRRARAALGAETNLDAAVDDLVAAASGGGPSSKFEVPPNHHRSDETFELFQPSGRAQWRRGPPGPLAVARQRDASPTLGDDGAHRTELPPEHCERPPTLRVQIQRATKRRGSGARIGNLAVRHEPPRVAAARGRGGREAPRNARAGTKKRALGTSPRKKERGRSSPPVALTPLTPFCMFLSASVKYPIGPRARRRILSADSAARASPPSPRTRARARREGRPATAARRAPATRDTRRATTNRSRSRRDDDETKTAPPPRSSSRPRGASRARRASARRASRSRRGPRSIAARPAISASPAAVEQRRAPGGVPGDVRRHERRVQATIRAGPNASELLGIRRGAAVGAAAG